MAKLFNLARMTTATTGTGTITLGSAAAGFLTFAGAGVTSGDVVSYGIVDGANREVGTGTYTSSGTTLSRTVITSTNSNNAISLSGSAQVFVTALVTDIETGYATTLPSSPVNGQEAILVDSTTAPSYQWRFRYNSGSSSSYKWEFIGGPPIVASVAANETTGSTSYADLSTAGPSITVPRAGSYIIDQYVEINAASVYHYSSPSIGGAAAADADRAQFGSAANLDRVNASRLGLVKTCAASDVVKLQYRVASGTGAWANRVLIITPVRVS